MDRWYPVVASAMALLFCATAKADDDGHDHSDHGGSAAYTVAQTCTGGVAGDYACSRINLISYINITQFNAGSLSDVWGWVDPETQDEYVLVGHFNGTTFVRITWPDMPEIVGFLPAHEDLVAARGSGGGVQKSCAAGRAKTPAVAHDDEGCGEGE
ncbi:MAG: hypothetical protein AAFU65_10465, partial [Pseudomonadota bacterium]